MYDFSGNLGADRLSCQEQICLKISLGGVILVSYIIIRTGSGLIVICGKNINWRGISNGLRLAL